MRKFTHRKIRENGDASSNYIIEGDFPVTFQEFVRSILSNTVNFSVEFRITNDCFGGWLVNKFEVVKAKNGEWSFINQEHKNLFDKIADMNIISCWANGGWGQMIYFCKLDEGSANNGDTEKDN